MIVLQVYIMIVHTNYLDRAMSLQRDLDCFRETCRLPLSKTLFLAQSPSLNSIWTQMYSQIG